MLVQPDFPLQVFYDGSCPVCAAEVGRYGRMDRDGRLLLVDISAPDFDPAPFGISRTEFMFQMHAIDRSGRIFRGVEAFRAIWLAFPSSTLLGLCAAVISLPLVNPLARAGYRIFARLRGCLPKRVNDCSSGNVPGRTILPCRRERTHVPQAWQNEASRPDQKTSGAGRR